MILEYNKFAEYPDVINSYYDLDRFHDGIRDWSLFQGYDTSKDKMAKDRNRDISKRVYLNLEAPTAFCSTDSCLEEQSYFTHVYTLCPYTSEYQNSVQNQTKYVPIPFPYRESCFSEFKEEDKHFDVIYMGTAMCEEHMEIVNSMKPYKYNFVSLYPSGNPTLCGVPSKVKWKVLNMTKISIAMNLCPIGGEHISWVKRNKDWDKISAFSDMDYGYIPQFKPRVIEAMRLNNLVLVKRDPWNVMEKWFEEGKHFIYWDTVGDLKEKMNHILKNYGDYQGIIAEANKRVRDFEIDKIYEKMKNGESVL
jgi:Glycosyl transferases group 1